MIEGADGNDGRKNQQTEALSLVSPTFNHSNPNSKSKDDSNLGSKVVKEIVLKAKKVPRE